MITIKDVARLANVSDTTVSRVLNNDESFSVTEDTRKSVFEAVQELGYKPLRRKKTSILQKIDKVIEIGVLLTLSQEDEVNDPYYQSIRVGIEKQCETSKNNLKKFVRLNSSMDSSLFADIDGLIVVGTVDPEDLRKVYFKKENIVYVNNSTHNLKEYDCVVSDLDVAIEDIIERLVGLGHKNIGYIGGYEVIEKACSKESYAIKDIRHEAFILKMKELNLFDQTNVYIGEWSVADAYRMMNEAIVKGNLPSAFIVGSDPMSIGVLHSIREAGISVPEDVSIVSFDDIDAAAFMNPPLSTVRILSEEIGKFAVTVLNDRIAGRAVPVKVVIPSQLIIRKSLGPYIEK